MREKTKRNRRMTRNNLHPKRTLNRKNYQNNNPIWNNHRIQIVIIKKKNNNNRQWVVQKEVRILKKIVRKVLEVVRMYIVIHSKQGKRDPMTRRKIRIKRRRRRMMMMMKKKRRKKKKKKRRKKKMMMILNKVDLVNRMMILKRKMMMMNYDL